MSDVDYRHVADLLKVIEGTVGHPGKLGAIAKAATDELYTLNEELRMEQAEAQKAADEEAVQKAAAKAEAVAAQKAEQDKAAQLQASQPKTIPSTPSTTPATDLTDAAPRRL